MTWKQQIVVKILLIIARMVNDDPLIERELQSLAANISVNGRTE